MATQKILEGTTGADAAQILYLNDLEAIRRWSAGAYSAGEKVEYLNRFYEVRTGQTAAAGDVPAAGSTVWQPTIQAVLKEDVNTNTFYNPAYLQTGKAVNTAGGLVNLAGAISLIDMPIAAPGTYTLGGYLTSSGKSFALANAAGLIKAGSTGNLSAASKTFTVAADGYNLVRATLKVAADPSTGWDTNISIVAGSAYLPPSVNGINGVPIYAKGLASANDTPDPTTAGNAVNKRYFDANALRVSDMTIAPSVNLAKTFILDQFVNNAGGISAGAGWAMCEILGVAEGQQITFGNFTIDSNGYWAFFRADGSTVSQGGHTTATLPRTVTWPVGATRFLFDTKRPANSPADSAFVMANLGPALLPFVTPLGTIVSIRGYPLGGSSNVSKFSDLTDVPPYTGNLGKALRLGVDEVEAFDAVEAGGDAVFSTIAAVAFAFDAIEWNGVAPPPAGLEINDAYFNTTIGALSVRKV